MRLRRGPGRHGHRAGTVPAPQAILRVSLRALPWCSSWGWEIFVFCAVENIVYYVDEIIVYGVVAGFAYSASVESPGVSWRANAGSPMPSAIAKSVPRTRSLILKTMPLKYSQKTLPLQQAETVCYIRDVPETLPQNSNLGHINSPGARAGAFPSSKSILDKYIKYLPFTLNASSGHHYLSNC